jgi:monomeric isocitrate dehydrogenase
MEKLEVLIPTAKTRAVKLALAPRLATLRGARIGWLDNQKANAKELLHAIATALKDGDADGEMVVLSKNATAAAPESVLTHLRTCDAVVLAISD